MYRAGDALLEVTDAYRINYEILGNSDAALHAHIIPRYKNEPDEKRKYPAMCGYSWPDAPKFNLENSLEFIEQIKKLLG